LGPYTEGQVLPVLTVVATIGKEDEKFQVTGATAAAAPETAARVSEAAAQAGLPAAPAGALAGGAKVFASPRARKLAVEKAVDLSQVTPTGWGGARVAERDVLNYLSQAPKATPLAQRIAADTGVDLRAVAGTGPGGKIVKEDIQRAAKPAPEAAPSPLQPFPPAAGEEVRERIPLKGVRAIIAERMGTSVHTTARVTLMMEVDATEFVAARERIKAKVSEEWGFSPGYNDLLAKIVASALRKFPYMNARLAPDAIELLNQVNLGMAVDTERGLLVPVIRNADERNVVGLQRAIVDLSTRARSRQLKPEEVQGGTFSITNFGGYGSVIATPVINQPQVAILGVGAVEKVPVVVDDAIAIRSICYLSLSFDHRLIDGALADQFTARVKSALESWSEEVL